MTFKELKISEPVLKALEEKQYSTPTPIQEQAIPIALSGKDLLGLAQTGTGKTAAFAIPIIEHLKEEKHDKKFKRPVRVLVLTPTRELALQIDESFEDYGKYTNLKHTVIFGGVRQRPQTDKLSRGTDILVATPGRLLDLIGQGFINLMSVTHFVLDEADRMLDMGFIHDIKRILPMLPPKRQTMLFSATMPKEIVEISQSILKNPSRVEATPESSTVDAIEQLFYFVDRKRKIDLLCELLQGYKGKSILVFSRTKHGADKIARTLNKRNIRCESIHGNKSQNARQTALNNFKQGKSNIIVATDIAARGIDIQNLALVINYDVPDVAETYVHRIGRTGRAGNSGIAISFCTDEEKAMYRSIQKLTGKTIPAKKVHFQAEDTNIGSQIDDCPEVEFEKNDIKGKKKSLRSRSVVNPASEKRGSGHNSRRSESNRPEGRRGVEAIKDTRAKERGEGAKGGARGNDGAKGTRDGERGGEKKWNKFKAERERQRKENRESNSKKKGKSSNSFRKGREKSSFASSSGRSKNKTSRSASLRRS